MKNSAWDQEDRAMRAILKHRLTAHGPNDTILSDIREHCAALWEQFDKARDQVNREACASPDSAKKCAACGCWKAVA